MLYQAENNKIPGDKNLKILNFYSENCSPCHAFMPNFIEAEKIFGKYFDFVAINSSNSLELFQKFRVMGTPTIIILDNDKILFNESGVPNGQKLKQTLLNIAGITQEDLERTKVKKKKFFRLF